MTRSSRPKEAWTEFRGQPVYWLAPEFWKPTEGLVELVLPGEKPGELPLDVRQKRAIEFLTLQGDRRYCDAKQAQRMRELMRERLGTETPWRGVPPAASQEPPDVSVPPAAAVEAPF